MSPVLPPSVTLPRPAPPALGALDAAARSPVRLSAAHRRFAVAPMMELTDRHFRHLARLLTRHALLWTEMLTARAVINGERERLLGTGAGDAPLVLQLGGSDPGEMAEAAAVGEAWGHDEININVGCPSDRVQSGRFGACLMAEPALVAANVRAMREAVSVPVSVKCRLGIDRDDSYAVLEDFVRHVADAGCEHVIVHARKAWLDGLSPKENRSVPPLRPEYVYRLKAALPELHITLNGGIDDWSSIHRHLGEVDGVMLGRHAYYKPAFLGEVDAALFGELPGGLPPADGVPALAACARDYARYTQGWVERGLKASLLLRHLVPLFQERPGARQWRRHLSEHGPRTNDAVALVEEALAFVERAAAPAAAARGTAANAGEGGEPRGVSHAVAGGR